MKCPFCSYGDTQVKDSRSSEDGRSTRRRRECAKCKRRFTTFERFQVQQTAVIKKDGTRELFDREKLLKSIMIAMRKRNIAQTTLSALVADVEQEMTENSRTEISSHEIGEKVLNRLKEIDFIGYVRYASVYNDFTDPKDFERLLKG